MYRETINAQSTAIKSNKIFSPVSYQLLSDEFYQKAVNELTDENLRKLAHFSRTIETPKIPGKFNNEEHYLKTLSLVLESTHETRNRILFFLKEVLPVILPNGALLDVGPGNGSLTCAIAKHFSHITAVDLNHKVLTNIEEILPDNIDYVKVGNSILNTTFEADYYDLAVMSHMLYYINQEHWLDVVRSAYKSLKKNGLLVIVLGGDELDKADLIKAFGGATLMTDQLALDCMNVFGYSNVRLCASDEAFVTYTKEAMYHVASFMLGDADVTALPNDLMDYIDKKFRQSNNYFEMTTRQKYILVRKHSNATMDLKNDNEVVCAWAQPENQ